MMTLKGTSDPNRIMASETEVIVLREDAQGAVDFAKELKQESNLTVRRLWERDYMRDIRERYGSSQIAGAMLRAVWDMTKGEPDAVPD